MTISAEVIFIWTSTCQMLYISVFFSVLPRSIIQYFRMARRDEKPVMVTQWKYGSIMDNFLSVTWTESTALRPLTKAHNDWTTVEHTGPNDNNVARSLSAHGKNQYVMCEPLHQFISMELTICYSELRNIVKNRLRVNNFINNFGRKCYLFDTVT